MNPTRSLKPPVSPSLLERTGQFAQVVWEQAFAMLSFLGEIALALMGWLTHPARIRWRPILFNLRSAGLDALPIVGLLSFLLGIVVAYQGADQLRQYGANIFVTDLVGLSMLREFAPLMAAIIIAGRSGTAYAAQIGTMEVTQEIDAMRTIGIAPLEMLVLPKFIALVIALPLLTVFADVMGVLGGMLGPLLASAIEHTGAFAAVVLTPASAACDQRLDTEIVRLQHNFQTTPSRVQFTLRAYLIDDKTRRVLAWHEFSSEVAAAVLRVQVLRLAPLALPRRGSPWCRG